MKPELYEIEDFVCDHSFQQYCREENDASIAFWSNWLAAHPHKAELVAAARQLVLLLGAGQGMRLSKLDQLQSGLRQRELFETSLNPEPSVKRRQVPMVLKYLSGIAACLLIAFLSWMLFYQEAGDKQWPPHALKYASNASARKTIVLPDGSLVTLNTNSRILLDPRFSATNRSLNLEGEGFFEVKTDPSHPFIVKTADITVRVLGTVFNLKAYSDSRGSTETTLLKGKVEISLRSDANTKYVLLPNEKLVTKKSSDQIETFREELHSRTSSDHLAKAEPAETLWLRSRLELSNERLEDIGAKLEKWYGIKIVFADDEVKSYRYTGTFETETVLRALEALQLSYPFSIQSESGKIILSKKQK